jgi:hypothetical protein
MSKPLKYKLAHDVLDSNGIATGETESEEFEITEICRLSPEWTLPHGPLCMRNTNFLIMEASMQDEELINGLPELKKMGLDPVRIIDEVRENFNINDFSDCGPTAAFEKLSKWDVWCCYVTQNVISRTTSMIPTVTRRTIMMRLNTTVYLLCALTLTLTLTT